jgi:hypothetical protein
MVTREIKTKGGPTPKSLREAPKASSSPAEQAPASPQEKRIPSIDELPHLDREILCALMAKKEELPAVFLRDPDLCSGVHYATFQFAQELDTIVSDPDSSLESKKESLKALLDVYGDSWTKQWKKAYAMLHDPEVKLDLIFEHCRAALRRAASEAQLHDLDRRIATADLDSVRMELSQQKLALKRQLQRMASPPNLPNT